MLVAAVALAVVAGQALAQETGVTVGPDVDRRTLVVTGRSTVTAMPDAARITVGVEAQAPSARQSHEAAARKAQRIVSAILALGIPSRDLQTTGIALTPVYRYDEKTRQESLVGYRASYTLQVVVEPLDRVGSVVDAAVEAGANRVESIQLFVRDVEAVKERAIARAVADAMAQARILAQSAGVHLGPVLAIRDVTFVAPGAPVRVSLARMAEAVDQVPVLPGELEFAAGATLVFEIR